MGIKEFLINLLFPKKCCFCGKVFELDYASLKKGAAICDECLKKYEYIGWLSQNDVLGPREIRVDGVFALYEYCDGVKNAMRDLKFKHAKENGVMFGEMLGVKLRDLLNRVDAVVTIPISKKREVERGYNQCEVIANAMVSQTNVRVLTNVLIKTDGVTRQSHKSGIERNESSKESFEINRNVNLIGKNVIVLDDILTTGSTLSAAVDLIRKTGVDKIYCVVFSVAMKRQISKMKHR